jgi:hypothetical protein
MGASLLNVAVRVNLAFCELFLYDLQVDEVHLIAMAEPLIFEAATRGNQISTRQVLGEADLVLA